MLLGNFEKEKRKGNNSVVYLSIAFSNSISYLLNLFFSTYLVLHFLWQPGQSALACLTGGLKEKLVETQETRNKFQCLYKNVHSLSADDALMLFHDSILKNRSAEQPVNVESSSNIADTQDHNSGSSVLENYLEELQSLLRESPAVKVHLSTDQTIV